MVLRKHKQNVHKPAVEAQPHPVLNALSKLTQGNALDDADCRILCEAVFVPAIRKQYHWIKNKVGAIPSVPSTRSTKNDGMNKDGFDVRMHRGPEPNPDDPVSTQGESDDDSVSSDPQTCESGRPASEPKAVIDEPVTTGDPFNDPFIQTAISELWARFSGLSSALDSSGERYDCGDDNLHRDAVSLLPETPLTIWQYAFKVALRETSPDVQETACISYLRECAKRETTKWLQTGGYWSELYRRIRSAIIAGGYTFREGETKVKSERLRLIVPTGKEHWPFIGGVSPKELSKGLTFPRLLGRSRHLLNPLPSPSQVQDFVKAFFERHHAAVTIEQLIEVAQHGWASRGLHDAEQVEFPDQAGEAEKSLSKPSSGDIERLTTRAVVPNPIETMPVLIIAAVELIDGCVIDPPSSDSRKGKLGRLLLEYAIWLGLPCTESTSGKYGIECYEALSGYGKTTENDRYNDRLVPLFKDMIRTHHWDRQTLIDVCVWLREKYIHRKPEMVVFDSFIQNEDAES